MGLRHGGTGNETMAYTPAGDRVNDRRYPAMMGVARQPCGGDEGKMLRVVVTYVDRLGAGRTARAVSDNPVRAEVSSDSDGPTVTNPENGSPGFTAGLDYTRTIPESASSGTNVGAPVVAIDPNDDTLTYGLVASAGAKCRRYGVLLHRQGDGPGQDGGNAGRRLS